MARATTRANPVHWLAEQAKTGLVEMPKNAQWLKSRLESQREAAGSKATEAAATVRSRAERAVDSVTEATPGGPDTIEAQLEEHASSRSEPIAPSAAPSSWPAPPRRTQPPPDPSATRATPRSRSSARRASRRSSDAFRRPRSRPKRWSTRLAKRPRRMPRTSCASSASRLTLRREPRRRRPSTRARPPSRLPPKPMKLAEARRLAEAGRGCREAQGRRNAEAERFGGRNKEAG